MPSGAATQNKPLAIGVNLPCFLSISGSISPCITIDLSDISIEILQKITEIQRTPSEISLKSGLDGSDFGSIG